MQIFINDSPCECPENSTLSDVLKAQHISSPNVAIAIDDTVIPKNQWETTIVREGSKILLIKAVQGG